MREMGGRNDFVVRASPSARFGRGFFSSINETVSIGARAGAGAGMDAAAAAAAAAAARERAAGVVAVGDGCAAFNDSARVALGFGAAGSAATADFAAVLRGGADLRALVLVDVVRLGIILKFFHGSRAANLRCGYFSRHRGVDLLRLHFVHT